ncbi:hypothetical protein BGV49_15970 [Burkholderia ubonensis]|nr:hypothetical protein BGV49_15970 [Burkholderia ubonensis]
MGGLGEAISIRLHDAGYRVVVTYSPNNNGVDRWLTEMHALLHEMVKRDAKRGLASLCIGGGMGVALAVERP